MDEEDDPIVEEIPVYLSKTLTENLYIFQYPLKSSRHNFDNTDVENCCIKPVSQQIKIDFRIRTDSIYYDAFRGEQFAINADGNGKLHGKNERPTFSSGTMDKQSFVSAKLINDVEKYVVCTVQDRELHITPIKSIVQLRQTFSYIDKHDKRKKDSKKDSDNEEEDEEMQQVTVKFSRTESDRVRKAREKSFSFISQIGAEEPWCETFWHSKRTSTAELERQKLYTTHTNVAVDALSLTAEKYLDALLQDRRNESAKLAAELALPQNVISMNKLRKMSLLDQIKHLLIDIKFLSFHQIMTLVSDPLLNAEKVLRTLPSAGILVRGNWTIQSEILYPVGSVSSLHGVPAELMCRARDYILFKLIKNDYLDRRKIALVVQMPAEELLEIFQSVAKLQPNKGWELLLPPDDSFELKYPDIVQRQQLYWRAKDEMFREMDLEKSPKRVRKKSVREGSIANLSALGAPITSKLETNKLNGVVKDTT